MTESLWNLPTSVIKAGPAQIMREQGDVLREFTNGHITGNIVTTAIGDQIANAFNLVVPALGYYTFTVAVYRQSPLALYPGHFKSAFSPVDYQVSNEEEFRAVLSFALGSEDANSLVRTLLAQIPEG